MNKNTLIYIVAILSFLNFGKIAMANDFIISDIPTMENMWVDEVIELDIAGERVVQVNTSSPNSIKEISNYYNSILHNFGWNNVVKNTYKRGVETLKLRFLDSDSDGTTVEFSIISK